MFRSGNDSESPASSLAAARSCLSSCITHPGRAFHSPVDDRLALPRHTGAISIVIADFAEKWDGDLEQASVNRHLGAGVWEELDGEAVSRLFEVR